MKKILLVLGIGMLLTMGCFLDDLNGSGDDSTSSGGGNYGGNNQGGQGGNSMIIKTFSDANSNANQQAYGLVMDSDGSFLITGYTEAKGAGGKDIYVLKVNGNGELIWDKTFGTSDSEEGRAIIRTEDANFLVVGSGSLPYTTAMKTQAMAIKLDSEGNEKWTKYFGGNGDDVANAVASVTNGYIITGSSNSYSSDSNIDLYVFKISYEGDTVWSSTFGGPYMDTGYGLVQAEGGSVVVVGAKGTEDAMCMNLYLVAVGSDGKKLWDSSVKDECSIGYSIIKNPDGGFIVAGLSNPDPMSSGDRPTIFQFDSSGNLIKKIVLNPSGTGIVYSLIKTDSSFIAAGYTASGIKIKGVIYGLDSTLNVMWNKEIAAPGAASTRFRQIIQTNTSSFAATGSISDDNNLQSIVFTRL